jgi:hypothetical protein
VFGSDEAGKDVQAAGTDDVVVVTLAKRRAAEFADLDAAAFDAVILIEALHDNDAVGDALELEIGSVAGGAVVEEKDGAVAAGEMALHGQNLAAVFKGIAGEHAQLGERIEYEALRLNVVDLFQDGSDGIGKLDFGGVEDGVLGFGLEVVLGGNELGNGERAGRPTVRSCDLDEFLFRFGERDVKDAFAITETFGKELESDGGFTGAGVTFEEVEVAGGKTAVKDVIESPDAGFEAGGEGMAVLREDGGVWSGKL